MGRMIYDYTKSNVEQSCNDKKVFIKEFRKAYKVLMPHEFEKLLNWLHFLSSNKPELKAILENVNEVLVS